MKGSKETYISLSEAAKITNYSQDYISLLCRQKKLKAEKLGRNWVTTKEWVYNYIDNSSGSGASVVPIKVVKKNNKNIKKSTGRKKIKASKSSDKKDFYGKPVLEFAVFCFSSILIICNFYAFAFHIASIDNEASTYVGYDGIYNEKGIVAGASAKREETNLYFGEEGISDSDFSILKTGSETLVLDDDLISVLQGNFSEEIGVEVLDDYAVIYYKDNPEKRFLYVENN